VPVFIDGIKVNLSLHLINVSKLKEREEMGRRAY
jgi:hypothetical protein